MPPFRFPEGSISSLPPQMGAHDVLPLTAGLAPRSHWEELSAKLDINGSFRFCHDMKGEPGFCQTLSCVFFLPTNNRFIPYKLMFDASRGYMSMHLQILIEWH